MKIIIRNENDEIVTKISDGEKERDFSYIELVEFLYDKKEVELEVANLDKELESKIIELFDKLKQAANTI
ncbi:MAG: hypothetical protein PHN55_12105 [Dysgonamonadaceae bacterium]|nr:hypothetical protein [Dysgonamonadaceae bacterium]